MTLILTLLFLSLDVDIVEEVKYYGSDFAECSNQEHDYEMEGEVFFDDASMMV